jgi:AraC family transcriptional regulator
VFLVNVDDQLMREYHEEPTVSEAHVGVPSTLHLQLDERLSVPAIWRNEPAFTIIRLRSSAGLPDRVRKVSTIPALLVSVPIKPLASDQYAVWVADQLMPTRRVSAFRANVIDFDAQPSCWAGADFDYVHFHVPRETLDDVAGEFGYASLGEFRPAILKEDLVLAQLTKSILPSIGRTPAVGDLELHHFQLVLAAHLFQRYGEMKPRPLVSRGGLAPWQSQRAADLLREHLDGSLRLSELAKECGLSVSHFARSFKVSFGMPSHRWLTRLRIEHAKDLLQHTREPLAQVALRSGFGDQPAFSRTFQRIVGVSPGRWRRGQA